MFDIPMSRKEVDKQLSKYQKINYNQFRWWRSYQPKNKPLDNRQPLRDRIFNGDFDYSCYKAQQYQVEYQLNDILEESTKQMVFYAPDNTTELIRYNLKDRNENLSFEEVFHRTKVN